MSHCECWDFCRNAILQLQSHCVCTLALNQPFALVDVSLSADQLLGDRSMVGRIKKGAGFESPRRLVAQQRGEWRSCGRTLMTQPKDGTACSLPPWILLSFLLVDTASWMKSASYWAPGRLSGFRYTWSDTTKFYRKAKKWSLERTEQLWAAMDPVLVERKEIEKARSEASYAGPQRQVVIVNGKPKVVSITKGSAQGGSDGGGGNSGRKAGNAAVRSEVPRTKRSRPSP